MVAAKYQRVERRAAHRVAADDEILASSHHVATAEDQQVEYEEVERLAGAAILERIEGWPAFSVQKYGSTFLDLFRSPAYGTISPYDYRIEAAALVGLGISPVAQSRTPGRN